MHRANFGTASLAEFIMLLVFALTAIIHWPSENYLIWLSVPILSLYPIRAVFFSLGISVGEIHEPMKGTPTTDPFESSMDCQATKISFLKHQFPTFLYSDCLASFNQQLYQCDKLICFAAFVLVLSSTVPPP